MNTKFFSEAMNNLDNKYISEAINYRPQKKNTWIKWSATAACLCMLIAGGIMLSQNTNIPSPNPVEISNPIMSVDSVASMEDYLDFKIPMLDKEVQSYDVFIVNTYPTMGQITYTDGSQFRMQYGAEEDISGIYNATLIASKDVDGISVNYYEYANITYAIWEQNGFSFSYVYTNGSSSEIETLIQKIK